MLLYAFKNIRFLTFVLWSTFIFSFEFTLSNYIHLPIGGPVDLLLNIGHFALVTMATFIFLYLLAVNKYLFAISFPLLVFLNAFISYFIYSQNLTLTTSVLDAALHNDFRTTLDLFSSPCLFFCFISLIISVIIVIYRWKYITFKFKIPELIVIAIIGILAFSVNFIKNHTLEQRLPFSIYYVSHMYLSQQRECKLPRQKIGIDATIKEDSLTVVLVIGEACRADHMQLNHYNRHTNPNLSKLDIISYGHIVSEWTHTNASLPHFLTRSDSAHHQPALQEHSFISIFNQCGFYTSWLANQEPAPSYLPFVKEAKSLQYVNPANSVYTFNKKWLDTDILKPMQKEMLSAAPKKLIILHTIGSHWWYNDHFTNKFAVYQPVLNTKIVSQENKQEMINSYDNTLVFTDYFLSQVISQLRHKNACLIYLSDHGESLGENGKWLHAQDTEPEKHPACLIWFSEKYQLKYPKLVSAVTLNKDKRWRTEFLFPSILSMATIQTMVKNKTLDITEAK